MGEHEGEEAQNEDGSGEDAAVPSSEGGGDGGSVEEARPAKRRNFPSPGYKVPGGILPSVRNPLSEIAAQFSRPLISRLSAQIKVPGIGIDPKSLGLGKSLAEAVRVKSSILSPFSDYLENQRKHWSSLFERLKEAFERALPPNWKGVDLPEMGELEAILLDEGIPLAWVPGPKIVRALFNAPDAKARRALLGRRWRSVVRDCELALSEVRRPALAEDVTFAKEVHQALVEGHSSSAQALAANLLDSILRSHFNGGDLKEVTKNKKGGKRFDLEDYTFRAAFTLAPIWRAYEEYWEHKGDSVPRYFGRHPSAHAVSRVQYSRINAVYGLMLVTSLLKLLDDEPPR